MMAHFRLIAAILLALSAIVLEAEGREINLLKQNLTDSLSPEELANAEKVFSAAKQYIGDHEDFDGRFVDDLLPAWDRVIHEPDQCDELSLGYMDTIAQFWPDYSNTTKTLAEASHKYASKCLTPEYIKERIDNALERFRETLTQKELDKKRKTSRISKLATKTRALVLKVPCFKNADQNLEPFSLQWRANFSLETEFKFIDDQFIDYFLAHPEDNILIEMKKNPGRGKSRIIEEAIAKAMIREFKESVKDMSVDDDRYIFLWKRLFKPCLNYTGALGDVLWQVRFASHLLEGRSEKLIASLDKDTQKFFSRFNFCSKINSSGGVDMMNNGVKWLLEDMDAI